MLNLDAYTLVVVSVFAAMLLALFMIGIYRAGNRERAVMDWALAGALFSIGHLFGMLSLLPSLSVGHPVVLALANGCVAVGYAFVVLGVQQHLERPRWVLGLIGAALVIALSITLVPALSSNVSLRVGLITLFYFAISVLAATWLWRADDPGLRPYRRFLAAVLTTNAIFMAARLIYVVVLYGLSEPPARNAILVPVFISSILFYMLLALSLTLMLFRRKESHLRFLARHDALTGLLNRYSLDECAAREMARTRRGEQSLSLVLLDLDNFKDINDHRGHFAGDLVLVQVARRIRETIREGDMAFRIGGEEFLVLLTGADAATAERIADRLRRCIGDRPIELESGEAPLSTSVGVATFNPEIDDWDSLQRRVDRALYRAKEGGRNRVEIAVQLPRA